MSVSFQRMVEENQPSHTTFLPFPTSLRLPDNDIIALITDFFHWLETDWQLPVFTKELQRPYLPPQVALTKEFYTVEELVDLYGYSHTRIRKILKKNGALPVILGTKGRAYSYRKQDLTPLLKQRNLKQLTHNLDTLWQHFFPPACETCDQCKQPYCDNDPFLRKIRCSRGKETSFLRYEFRHFLWEVYRKGSVAAWWRDYHVGTWGKQRSSAWGILFIYLLDRRLIHLSYDELLQLKPIRNKGYPGMTRLWRNRRPEEYQQFLQAMEATNYQDSEAKGTALRVIGLFILLKYGLNGLTELGRPLTSKEIQQVCSERRLVTWHIGSGIFLPYPLTKDIRVGHVILDDIRWYLWHHAANQNQKSTQKSWFSGPCSWTIQAINIIEQSLAAPMFEQAEGIISRRPETEKMLINPLRLSYKGKLADAGYDLLPSLVQEYLMAYFTYCHQQRHLEIATLVYRAHCIPQFFTWVRQQKKLGNFPHWTREYSDEVFRTYASHACVGMKASTRRANYITLANFFSTLHELGYAVPVGYHILYNLEKYDAGYPRNIPNEEIMDRVFRDGVCNLTYDVFSRLALTIQYYCGTRISETLDLHLFCVLEDQRGHAFLLIPKGKSKQERPFPIVEPGMEFLFQYMEEIIKLRFSADGTTSRTLGKTNMRYQDEDPERAVDWHYVFDRVPIPEGRGRMRGRLSRGRVEEALREALLIAAKINPDGLFQQESYSPTCHREGKKGQLCSYFAAEEGITVCPCCNSPLTGRRGSTCYHILEEDFKCDGIARDGEAFCPKCDAPLAAFSSITPHTFRHNSVSRAYRAGVSLAHNMKLHGHETIPMHLRYLHTYLEDTTDEVISVFAEKRIREVRQALRSAPGQIVEGGIAYTVSLEQYLGLTLQRTLKRWTYGIWGGFWAGALAQRGVASPLSLEDEIVIPEDTYEHTVAQYWYEALGLAVSEVAFERVTQGKWQAEVPPFLDRQKIEGLVQFHLHIVQDSLGTALGMRLMETDIMEQRRFLDDLAEKLRPWWKHLGTIDPLVEMFMPMQGGSNAFCKQLPSSEPAP
jgi:site-specific recombinase XerD